MIGPWIFGGGAIAIAVLGAALTVQTLRVDNANLRADRNKAEAVKWMQDFEEAKEVFAENEQFYKSMQAEAGRLSVVAADEAARADALQRNYETLKRNTAHAEDGPIAPVLRGVLDGLRVLEAGTPGTGGAGEAGDGEAGPAR